jgi:NAD-dependent dihydropyrimidine dehydrogenase PreA subunit
MAFSYTIVADTCEGIADCIPVCPVECIHWARGQTNTKGTKYVYIDAAVCIDCGACLSVCPIEGAILDEWRPELQKPNAFAGSYSTFEAAWRTPAVLDLARAILAPGSANSLPVLADALEEAGCTDLKLLDYCRQGWSCSGGRWVAQLILG